jgi:ankyrin repeat protein
MLRTNTKGLVIAGVASAAIIAALVGLLVSMRDDGPAGTLADAVGAGDADLVRAHLEAGADPDEPRVFGLTLLMRAAIRNDPETVALLLGAGADLEATAPEGLTATHVAAEADAVASLEVLVAAGGDVSAKSHNGMNALHHAADLGSADVIEYLAERGSDLEDRSEVVTQGHGHPRVRGATALGIAARAGQLEAVGTLLAFGADVDGLSASGHSPLLIAVFSGQSPEVVSALLAAGADPRIEASCEDGGCSLDPGDALVWARQLDQSEMVPLLEAAMAP